MNKKQLVVLWVTIGILALLAIFPVRQAGDHRNRGFFLSERLTKSHGRNRQVFYSSSIDLKTLIAQMIPFTIIGTGLIITLKDKKS